MVKVSGGMVVGCCQPSRNSHQPAAFKPQEVGKSSILLFSAARTVFVLSLWQKTPCIESNVNETKACCMYWHPIIAWRYVVGIDMYKLDCSTFVHIQENASQKYFNLHIQIGSIGRTVYLPTN